MITSPARLPGVLLVTAVSALVVSAILVVPTGLTLNPSDPAATLAAVADRTALHLVGLAVDVAGWLALLAAGLGLAAGALLAERDRGAATPGSGGSAAAPGRVVQAGGLLASAGLAGLLHDAGNLAITQLAADPGGPAVAAAVLHTAKWTVNLTGLLWVASLVAYPGGGRLRLVVAVSGLASVVLPWTSGTAGPSPALEQLGYVLHLPVMLWFAALGVALARRPTSEPIGTPVP